MIKIAIFCPHKLIDLFRISFNKFNFAKYLFVYEENAIPKYDEYHFKNNEDFQYNFLFRYNTDLAIVYGWNHLIPEVVLTKIDFYNLHPSLLPKYRGPYPVVFQLLNKEDFIGVTLHKMDKYFDSGDIFLQEKFAVDYENIALVETKIFRIATRMMCRLIDEFNTDSILLKSQNCNEASYFSKNDLVHVLNCDCTYEDLLWMIKVFDIYKPFRIIYNNEVCLLLKCNENNFLGAKKFKLKDRIVYLELASDNRK